VAGRKKKLPWNHNLRIPGYGSAPAHPKPKPLPETVTVGHSTPGGPREQWECLRCEQLREGRDPTVPEHHRASPSRGAGRDPQR